MKLSAILAPMIAANVPGDVILATVRAYEDQADAMSEEGKEKARVRWRRWKNKQGTNVGKRLQTDTNVSKPLVRVEDSSSKVSISEEDKSPAAPSPRGTRIPDGFEPDLTFALGQKLSLSQAKHEAAQFVDYWRSKAGKDGLKLDWPGTWRVWVRNSGKRYGGASPPPQQKPRNAGELARLQLREQEQGHASNIPTRHLEQSDREPGFAGTGIARRIALASSR